MNVNQLHKALSALVAQGHGRKPVCINKNSFRHPLEEDGAVILGVKAVNGPTFIVMTDDDGGTKFNKDGTESGSYTVILDGGTA
jgi:hypothetical protein